VLRLESEPMKTIGWLAPVLLLLASCATRAEPVYQNGAALGVAPALTVERFLQAANSQDLTTMGRLFGTTDGPVIERFPRDEVEKWMFALAAVLRHMDYRIEREQVVPGRPEATQLVVRMQIERRQIPVAYTLVRSKGGA